MASDIHRILFGKELEEDVSPEFLTSLEKLLYADTSARSAGQMRLHTLRLLKTLDKLGLDTSVGLLWCVQREENYLRALEYKNIFEKSWHEKSLYTRIEELLTFIGNQLQRLENAFNIKNVQKSFKDRLDAIEEQENISYDTTPVVIAQRLKHIFEH